MRDIVVIEGAADQIVSAIHRHHAIGVHNIAADFSLFVFAQMKLLVRAKLVVGELHLFSVADGFVQGLDGQEQLTILRRSIADNADVFDP